MTPRTGRPFSENPKDKLLQVRVDAETLKALDACADEKETSRSEIVREGIHMVQESLNECKKTP